MLYFLVSEQQKCTNSATESSNGGFNQQQTYLLSNAAVDIERSPIAHNRQIPQQAPVSQNSTSNDVRKIPPTNRSPNPQRNSFSYGTNVTGSLAKSSKTGNVGAVPSNSSSMAARANKTTDAEYLQPYDEVEFHIPNGSNKNNNGKNGEGAAKVIRKTQPAATKNFTMAATNYSGEPQTYFL